MLCYLNWIVVVTSTDDADNDDVSDDNDYNILCILCVGDMDVLLLYTMTVLHAVSMYDESEAHSQCMP